VARPTTFATPFRPKSGLQGVPPGRAGFFRLRGVFNSMQWRKTLRLTFLTLRLMLLVVLGTIFASAVFYAPVPAQGYSEAHRVFRPDHRAEVAGLILGACLHNYLLGRR
jgi:hypothetical protein